MFQRRKHSKSNKSVIVLSSSSVSDRERAINLDGNIIEALDTSITNQCSSNMNIRVGIPSNKRPLYKDYYCRRKSRTT
ncbi:hypothetical protein NC651_033453 [Populus alba x Populus x berolinensis]|nr:hypothetical protein NC651_033453 [Populus alba x Populus x berolinensis]